MVVTVGGGTCGYSLFSHLGYEEQYQARLETFREYLEKAKQAAVLTPEIQEDSMQVDALEQANTENIDEDELVESGDELINTNPTSPL